MGALRPGLRWGKGGGGLPWRESHEEVRVGWWWAAMVGGPWGGEGRQPARAPSWPSKCPGQWAAHQGILPEGNICGKSTLAPCFNYFFFFSPPTLLHFDFSFEGTCQQLALRGELLAEGTAAHWNASARSCETFLRNICLHPLPSVV